MLLFLCFGIMEFLIYLCCLIESHCFLNLCEVCPSTSNVAVLEGIVYIWSVTPTRMEPCEEVEGGGLRQMLHMMSVSKNWEHCAC